MRKHARGRVRSRKKLVLNDYNREVAYYAYTQQSEHWELWTYRTISLRAAKLLVATGEATTFTREVAQPDGTVGVMRFYREATQQTCGRPTPATLTLGTMEAVRKEAQCERMSRRQRDEVIKFRVWPLIGDTKAVAVRPRMSAEEFAYAGKVMPLTESERVFYAKQMARVAQPARKVA